ncbi:MAG: YbjN domain-containing protein [Clostridia bacterium]|nr:YbjN domain-containing protein [Clostridia bacterium]
MAIKLNLRRLHKNLFRYLNQEMGLDFEYTFENDKIVAKNDLTINGIDDDILAKLTVYQDGLFVLELVFDKLDYSEESLRYLNTFNEDALAVKAYIRNDGYLVLDYTVITLSEDTVIENLRISLNHIVGDKMRDILHALTDLTYSNN